MTITVYAAKLEATEDKLYGPLFGFETHQIWRLRKDADAVAEQGQDPFEVNPDYVQGAGFDISRGNWAYIARTLALDPDQTFLDVDHVAEALEKYGEHAIVYETGLNNVLYIADKMQKLQQMVALCRQYAVDKICVAG
jgi:hypothetical protein